MSNQALQDSSQLLRKMNLLDSTFLVIGELGAMYPRAGGQYIYLREAYGPWAGFLYGWGFFWVIECGGVAALAVGFSEYFGYFVPALSTKTYLLRFQLLSLDYSLSAGQLIAVASILFLTAINYLGVKGDLSFNIKLFGLALIAVLWTYDGWYGVNCAAEEIKNPGKNIPRGLILGTLSVTLIYFLVNVVYVTALPVERMKGVVRIGELASTQLFGPTATFFISATIMISIFGCLSASILYGPRVFFAMAQDRCFFKSMRFVHPRYSVPTKAIVWQGIWSSLLCLSGTYQDLFEYVVFALVIFWAATGLAVIILRFKQPETSRPYKAWGYPILPILFVLINIGVFLNTIWAQPLQSLIGLIILIAGIPAFLYWQSKDKSA
jgi:APA family basic amino acid/polyamine antiporter